LSTETIRIDEDFLVRYKQLMQELSVAEAAKRLGVSPRRVQQLVKAGRLPAEQFAGAYVIRESDLGLVADRRPGRPANHLKSSARRHPVKVRGSKKKHV
jgi:excisionase family DNA binding protein